MKTLNELNDGIKELQAQIKELEGNRKEIISRMTGVNAELISVLRDDLTIIRCKSILDVSKVLNNVEPYSNGHIIDHKKEINLVSRYRVDVDNGYYDRKLSIKFSNMLCEFWIQINFNDMPEEIKEKYFERITRGLFDSETVYVNMQSYTKGFKDIRIQAYKPTGNHVNWYGGDKTVICETWLNDFITELKKY